MCSSGAEDRLTKYNLLLDNKVADAASRAVLTAVFAAALTRRGERYGKLFKKISQSEQRFHCGAAGA